MMKNIAETFWHEPQISCLPPYEQVKPNVQYFILLGFLFHKR